MLGSILAAGGNLIGGILGSRDKAKDRSMQKEFAQHGIRWKVEDARAAGLHPLAGLGMSGSSYSPQGIAVGSSGPGPDYDGAMHSMGQNISRAVNATRTQGERDDATMRALQLENQSLQNDYLRTQIAQQNSAQNNPPFPAGQIKNKPAEITSSAPGLPSQEAGAINDVAWGRTASGGLTPVPSKDMKERIEDQVIQETNWSLRNNVLPSSPLVTQNKPSRDLLPKGAIDWEWTGLEYRPVYDRNELRSSSPPWARYKRKGG